MMTRLPADFRYVESMLEQMSPTRRADMLSVAEQLNLSPADLLCLSVDKSTESFTYFEDAAPVAMGGVVEVPIDGTPVGAFCWMVASTEGVERHKKYFLQESRDQIDRWFLAYGTLFSDVAADEAKSIRWLEWLGFHRTGKMQHLLGRDVCRLERRS